MSRQMGKSRIIAKTLAIKSGISPEEFDEIWEEMEDGDTD